MAIVYRAWDVRHQRAVALKCVLPEVAAAAGVDRFLREIELAARLQHPHIVPLFDSGEVGGAPWYVMPVIEGESLRDRIARESALPLPEALRIAAEIAGALAHAHGVDVVHRDIKPGNVLLSGGHAWLADFGIARVLDGVAAARLTATGLSVGTPSYMSPEQATGERRIDGRSDVYSLGCVLFEMLSGQPPYVAPTAAGVVQQHLAAPIPDVRMLRAGVPTEVARWVERMLAKSPADRPQAADVASALLRLHADAMAGPVSGASSQVSTAPMLAPPRARAVRRRRLWAVGAALAAVAIAIAWAALRRHGVPLRSIAVLPLVNLSGDPDQEYFAEGMTEELINELGRVTSLRVISRTSVMALAPASLSVPQIARRLGVEAVVEGTVARAGDRVRVSAELVQADPERSLWSERYDRGVQDVLALQSDLAQTIVRHVQARLTPEEHARIVQARVIDPAAEEEYLRGRYHLNRVSDAGYRAAIDHFERALERDPGYAAAWAGLSDAYYGISNVYLPPSEAMPKARAAAERALQLDPQLAAGYRALGVVQAQYEFRWADAESSYVRSLRLGPSESLTHLGYMFLLSELGRFDEARTQAAIARQLDPLSQFVQGEAAYADYVAGRYEDSRAEYQAMLRSDSSYAVPYYSIALCDLELGRKDEVPSLLLAATRAGDIPFASALWAYDDAISGRGVRARARIDSLAHDPRVRYSHVWGAWVEGVLGDRDAAFAELNRGYAAHDEDLVWIQVDPKFRSLRGDPRFAELLRRMGLSR